MDRNKPDSDSDGDDKDDGVITPPAEGSYVNSRGLRHSNREWIRTQSIYTKVVGTGKKYAEESKGKEGPMDSYKSFIAKGIINMNAGEAEDHNISDDEVHYNIIGVVMAQYFSLNVGLKKFGSPGRRQLPKR